MGLWLVQECRRAWGDPDYAELTRLAEDAPADVPLFDPDDDAFLGHGRMPERIADACTALGQRAPEGQGETVRAIAVSLACKYRLVLEQLELTSGRSVDRIHVIGGGARNALLCQLTADVTAGQVLAGPVEARRWATSSCRRVPPGGSARSPTCGRSPRRPPIPRPSRRAPTAPPTTSASWR